MQSLQDKIDAHGNVVDMLRNAPTGSYVFPVPVEHSNWRDEQRAWSETAILFDQSFHMTDINFRGPDVKRLLSENSINNYENLAPLKAFQFTTCAANGMVIADAIGIGLEDESVSIIGKPTPGLYLEYVVQSQGLDVEVRRDARTIDGNVVRGQYRFQIIGPNAYEILERATGTSLPETRFFRTCKLSIAGHDVTGLRHTMTGGQGLEFWGPFAEREAVLDAILEAGSELGLRRGGAKAYSSAAPYSGWAGSLLPAIYTGEDMRGFREHLPALSFEGTLSLGGSLDRDEIEVYYFSPWDVGYHRFIHWDHDFHGRDALMAMRDQPHRKKVWLRWNDDDAMGVFRSQLNPDGERAKYLDWPSGQYANSTFDEVRVGDTPVGISMNPTYTVQTHYWFTLAVIDTDYANPGREVVVTWGEPTGGSSKPTVEQHVQTDIRATVVDQLPG